MADSDKREDVMVFDILLDPTKNSASGNNNFLSYKKHMEKKLRTRYPDHVRIFEDNIPLKFPKMTSEECNLPDAPPELDLAANDAVFTAAQRRDFYVAQFAKWRTKKEKFDDKSKEIFNHVLNSFTEDALDLVRGHRMWRPYTVPGATPAAPLVEKPGAKVDKDLNVLWEIVIDTHVAGNNGGSEDLKRLSKNKMQNNFNNMKQQPTETITEFKIKFAEHLELMDILAIPRAPEAELAITFMDKLDDDRHGPMRVQLHNNAVQGIKALPRTYDAMYLIAKDWAVSAVPGTKSDSGVSILLTSDQQRKPTPAPTSKPGPNYERNAAKRLAQKAAKSTKETSSSGNTAQRPTNKEGKLAELRTAIIKKMVGSARAAGTLSSVGCLLCGGEDHHLPECAVLPSASEADLSALLKTYDLCVWNACPHADDNHEEEPKIIDVVGELGELVDNATTAAQVHVETRYVNVMFKENELILDSGAAEHIVRDSSLLQNLRPRANWMSVHGVTGDGFMVKHEGDLKDLCIAAYSGKSVGNIVSQSKLKDGFCDIFYDNGHDEFLVVTPNHTSAWLFVRKLQVDGIKSPFYSCNLADPDSSVAVLIQTVANNERRYTVPEVKKANAAVQFMERLGHVSQQGAIDIINGGVLNSEVTATDVRNATAIRGASTAALKGKTTRKTSTAAKPQLVGPRVTQVQQTMDLDIFFVKRLAFIVAVLSPLGLSMVQFIKDRSFPCVATSVRTFLALAASRDFSVKEVRVDGEGALAVMVPELQATGITVNPAGPGEHVPRAERMIKTIKERVRAFDSSLPYIMTKLLLVFCVLFCASRVNLQPSATSLDKVSPQEQFSGFKLDQRKDLRVGFGELVQATVPVTDNTMSARTQGCISLLPTGNSTGSVIMWHMATNKTVTRDQFTVQPMPDNVCEYISSLAVKQGYSRGFDPSVDSAHGPDAEQAVTRDTAAAHAANMPEMMAIDGRATEIHPTAAEVLAGHDGGVGLQPRREPPPASGPASTSSAEDQLGSQFSEQGVRWSRRLMETSSAPILFTSTLDSARSDLRKQLLNVSHWRDTAFALKVSVRRALRDKPKEATDAIIAELKQMLNLKVWHPVLMSGLSESARKAILRTQMFLKEKFTADGLFEKLKARLVAGGDKQDKELYDNLSSPTAATSSVLTVAAIAAAENRHVMTIDVGGAFLNADITSTGIKVHVRLDRVMTSMLTLLDPTYKKFVDKNGTVLVELDKALYGCVEAAALWYQNLSAVLIADGFVPNLYDPCIFNKIGPDGVQITLCLHVDDIMATSTSQAHLKAFDKYLTSVYPEVKAKEGRVVNYVGMTFDFTTEGEVRVTMDQCVKDILDGCGVVRPRATPAGSNLFEIREGAEKVSEADAKYFHTHVAKMLYLSKRVRPECLGAVAFLSTRVQDCDVDDLDKLERLLGYLAGTPDRGIVLRIGENLSVRAYIDAAYGVHTASGKSHTGCAIVLGEGGPVYVKSSKQKIVTKSSTEAELVGLSDTSSQALHLRNFVIAQGYEVGPAVLYQDNLSTMALMKRGGPGSERSRHINIRHYWLAERVANGEAIIEHLSTDDMWANAMTKPVQGAQFIRERAGLTNWE